MGFKKIFLAAIILVLASDLTTKVSSYTRAEVTIPATISIASAKDSLLAFQNEATQSVKVKNNMDHNVYIRRIKTDNKNVKAVLAKSDIILHKGETKTIPIQISIINPDENMLSEINVVFIIEWEGGSAVIQHKLPVKAEGEEVTDTKAKPAPSNQEEIEGENKTEDKAERKGINTTSIEKQDESGDDQSSSVEMEDQEKLESAEQDEAVAADSNTAE